MCHTHIQCLLTNNSNVNFTLAFKAIFYNDKGEKISVNNLGGLRDAIFKGQTTAVSIEPPTNKEYSYYTLEYTDVWQSVNYKNMSKYITIKANEVTRKDVLNADQKYVDLDVYNSSDENVMFNAYIKFYKDDKLVVIQNIFTTLDINTNNIQNRTRIDFQYDKYEVVYTAKATLR